MSKGLKKAAPGLAQAQVHLLALLHCQLHFSGRHIVDSDLYPVTPPFTHPTVPVRPAIEELNGYRAGPGD